MKGAIPMDKVSRKALLNLIETKRLKLIESDDDYGADILEMWIDEIERGDFYTPSTESEGEWKAISEVVQRENAWLRAENERMRAALQLIKDHELMTRLEKTLVYRVADEALSTTSETAHCGICGGYGGWHDGDGPLSEPVPCPGCNESGASETAVQPTGWIDGPPPEFEDEDEVLIVAELPSMFADQLSGFRAFRRSGGSWGNKVYSGDRHRAIRWMRVPLPGTSDTAVQPDREPVYGSPDFPYVYHDDHIDGRTIVPEYVVKNFRGIKDGRDTDA